MEDSLVGNKSKKQTERFYLNCEKVKMHEYRKRGWVSANIPQKLVNAAILQTRSDAMETLPGPSKLYLEHPSVELRRIVLKILHCTIKGV